MGLQIGSAYEVSLIIAPGTICSAVVTTRPYKPSQMGFVWSQGTHMLEATLALLHRKPYLGFGELLPFFGCPCPS